MAREEEEEEVVVGVLDETASSTSTTGMLLLMQRFLERLSGRRQRRHVRRFSSSTGRPGARTAAGGKEQQQQQQQQRRRRSSPLVQQQQQQQQQQQHSSSVAMEQPRSDEEELLCCCRCRSGRSCTCALLGLDNGDDDDEDDAEDQCSRTRTRGPTMRRTLARQRSDEERRKDCDCAGDERDVLRRRPPECRDCQAQQYPRRLVGESSRKRRRNARWLTSRSSSSPTASSSSWSSSSVATTLLPSYLATLLILSYSFIGMADACSSRSTPKPRPPTPTPRPNITFHMYTCPPEYAEWYCLNGATCFTVKIVQSLLYNCLCANGYIGQRCEFKDLDGSYLPSRQRVMLETASIAGAVTIAVFLAVITFISVYIHCKRKQKELRTSSGVDAVDGVGRDPELRPFCTRSRSLMIFMAKNPNSSTTPSIEQTRMPNWNYPTEAPTRMSSVNENKRPSK